MSELLIDWFVDIQFEVNMSDKPRLDASAPARGLFKVALKKVSGETVDFEYVSSSELFNSLLTIKL
jgi:hypothetical protein